MGFQVTTPTAVPVDGDGSQDQESWGESGVPFSVPAEEGAGMLASQPLTANNVNYRSQKSGRWSRATSDRAVLSDEGLFSSCVVSQGTFNIGGGTLDVTLTPTNVVVDADNDGGIKLELKAPAGSPETLAASRDTYLNLNEAGAYELQVVALDDPPPVPTAGYVSIWVLVTDATELTAANLAEGIAPFPCLGPTVGIRAAVIEDSQFVNAAVFEAGIEGGSGSPVAMNEGATVPAGKSIVGNTATATLQQITALNFVEAGLGFQGSGGSVALLPQGAKIPVNKTLELGQVTPTTIGELSRSATGDQLYHNGSNLQAPGIFVSAQQTANTGPFTTVTTMTTGTRQGAPVNLYVSVEGYFSRSVNGPLTLTIEEDDGALTYSTLVGAFVTPTIGAAFTFVKFSRLRVLDSTARLFRLVAATGDAALLDLKEAMLTVYPAGG